MSTTERLNAALEGRYRVERQLGQGGMATVYLAQDLKHDRKVALKVLKPELSAVLGADRFIVEIKTTASLQHPHILPLFDSGAADGMLFYVMPYIEGETLRDKLNRETQLGIDEAVRITTEVADALDYAHRHGVIHRDIKPENILLHDGRPVVADFGIALAVSAAAGGRMTETGLSLGTPHYMSPEQATAEKEITARSDIYSLASVLYEMLGGSPPHMAGSAQQIIMKIIAEPAEPVTKYRKTVPEYVAAALAKALEKLPADRFESAKAFADALRNPHFATASISAAKASVGAGGRRWMIGAWLGVGAIAGAVVMWFVVGGRGSASLPVFEQHTFSRLNIQNARWAADGKTIVFTAGRFGGGVQPSIRIVRPEYPEPQMLADSANLLSVSATNEIAMLVRPEYVSQRIYRGTLARMSIGGGAPKAIADSVMEADWSPDGNQLAITRNVGDRTRIEYPIGKVIFDGPSGGYLSDLRVSPDGGRVAFMLHRLNGDDRGAVAIVDRQGKVTVGNEEFSGMQGVAWDGDGQGILFSAQAAGGGDYQLHRWRAGAASVPVLPMPGRFTMYDVRAGRWLVSRDEFKATLIAKAANAPQALDLTWLDNTTGNTIAADGRSVALTYQGTRTGPMYEMFVRPAAGGAAVRLGEGTPLTFSNDNKWVLSVLPTSPQDVRWYSMGAAAIRPVKWSLHTVVQAVASSDGKSLYVCGAEKGHDLRCYTSGVDGSNLKAATPEGLMGPPRPDFKAALLLRDGKAIVYPFDGSEPHEVPGLKELPIRWSPDGAAVWVSHPGPPRQWSVDRVDVSTGRRSKLLTLDELDGESARPFLIQVGDDAKSYSYLLFSFNSSLFSVEGVK